MKAWQSCLFLIPLLAFVSAALLLSCGSGSSGGATVTPAPPGPFIEEISICPGAPPSPTPTPNPSASPTAGPTQTPCPQFTVAAVPQGCQIQFHAVATLSDETTTDITDATSTLWTSDTPNVLSSQSGGLYSGVSSGTANAGVSSGAITSPPVGVTIGAAVSPCPPAAAAAEE